MKVENRSLIVILFFAITQAASAAEVKPPPAMAPKVKATKVTLPAATEVRSDVGQLLELKDVLRQGLEFSPIVKAAMTNWEAAKATLTQAEQAMFPTIDLVSSGTFNDNPSRVSTSTTATRPDTHTEQYIAALKLTQPLYKGGLLTNGIASTKLNSDIFEQNYISVRQNAVSELILAYYGLAFAQRRLALAQDQRDVLQSYSNIVGRYEKIGRSRKMDRLQATVNLSLSEAERVKAESDRLVASDNLKRLLGISESNQPLSGKLEVVVAPAAPLSVEEAFEASIKSYPEYRAVELAVQKQKYDNNLDLVADKPSLNLTGEFGFKSPDRPGWFEDPSKYNSVGLELKVPLFSGFSSFSKRQRHSQLLKSIESSLDNTRLQLRQEIQSTISSLTSEYQRLTAAQLAAEQGREALRLANAAYGQGVASNQDVLNAQRTRNDSEKLLIDSQSSYLSALLKLRKLMGVNLEKIYIR